MPAPSIHYIEDLTPNDIELLTQLLSIAPGRSPATEWLLDQETCLSAFPPILLRPEALLPRITMSLPFTPQKAHLCKTHKYLNSYLIRRIFLQVSAECTTRAARLGEHPCLPERLSVFVKRIHSINSLWMSPELYRAAFYVTPFEARFERVASGCEACILATIGGNHQILSDLRTSMLGRRKKRSPNARLLKLVDAWIDWTGRGDDIREDSDELGREVRSCRRQMQHARRQKRRNIGEGILDGGTEGESTTVVNESTDAIFDNESSEKDDQTEHDLEGSIIDLYAKRLSKSTFLDFPYAEEAIHPAFRDSITFDIPSGTFTHRDPGPAPLRSRRPPRPVIYSATAYNSSQKPIGLQRRSSSEDHAEAYRNLIGIQAEEADIDGKQAES